MIGESTALETDSVTIIFAQKKYRFRIANVALIRLIQALRKVGYTLSAEIICTYLGLNKKYMLLRSRA